MAVPCFLSPEVLEPYAPMLRGGAQLEGALQAPAYAHRYGGIDDPVELATCLLCAVTRAHALIDGNKRASVCLADLFLAVNALRLEADEDRLYRMVMQAAIDPSGEARVGRLLRACVRPGAPGAPFQERYPAVMERLAR